MASHILHEFADGSKPSNIQVETKRVSISSIVAGLTGNVTVTFDTPFADANYTLSDALYSGGGVSIMTVQDVTNKTATGCVYVIKNIGLTGTGTLEVTAIHD